MFYLWPGFSWYIEKPTTAAMALRAACSGIIYTRSHTLMFYRVVHSDFPFLSFLSFLSFFSFFFFLFCLSAYSSVSASVSYYSFRQTEGSIIWLRSTEFEGQLGPLSTHNLRVGLGLALFLPGHALKNLFGGMCGRST